MFESTGWSLIEPSGEDVNKYDNICPTVVSWTPEKIGAECSAVVVDSLSSGVGNFIESTKVGRYI